ncbi:UvrD/REP helicase [Candidatus Omnitrophus magneticus]|uniref:DNA 3'-5' helicase n=1 Tax=Candidatus Omnitrophus magneticus TaxID=1609969 RepID=A0A0F0CV33_9BACT|nr:UvrD/REP helicase [Candidatus Omnitrophus magneticus]
MGTSRARAKKIKNLKFFMPRAENSNPKTEFNNMKEYFLNESSERLFKTRVDFKKSLNEEQYKVVTDADGPCLVLAGAGSGKTRTLCYRLAYLLEKGINPENILLMTFTNKAANEMRERVESLLEYKPKGLWSGTFHHIGNRVLRQFAEEAGLKNDFGILDENDSRDIIKTSIEKYKTRLKDDKFPKPAIIQSIISFSANTDTPIEKNLESKFIYFLKFAEDIKKIAREYTDKKKLSNNVDYDDLLIKWKLLLEKSENARDYFSNKFQYIMIDEYQDTNYIQAEIIALLAARHRNILAVGDDAQSIYSFRGARVENILTFAERFRGARIFKLETNYRSTPEILELANNSLINNKNQYKKKLKAVLSPLTLPALVKAGNTYSQAGFICQRIKELQKEGMTLRDIAVLFRAHYQSAELEMELVKRGIPYVVRGGIRFFEQAHIKDILAFLKILANPMDEISWLRALGMCEGIGPKSANKIFEFFQSSGLNLETFIKKDLHGVLTPKMNQGYTRFLKIMRPLIANKENKVEAMIKDIMESGYKTYMLATYENAQDRIEDINELINFSHDYASLSDFLSDMTLKEGFRGEVLLSRGDTWESDYLVLSTIHQAKGLEWNVVITIGLVEGQFPNPKVSTTEKDIEEERRLFYVAVTRAKKYLYLLYPMERYDYQKGVIASEMSRFLEELDSDKYEIWELSYKNQHEYRNERFIDL